MAKKRPVDSFENESIVFEEEKVSYRLLRLDPNRMTATLLRLCDNQELTRPFAHLPKSVKKKIRPL